MLKSRHFRYMVAATILGSATVPTNLAANEIALTLKEQGITISGDFAGFRDKAYIVLTSTGLIHVPAEIVTCEGADCLVIVAANTADN